MMSDSTAHSKQTYQKFKYSEEDLEKALDDVRNKSMSLSHASTKYRIPKGTLHNKLTGKTPEKRKMGPCSVLTTEEEVRLEKWILDKAKVGFPMHPEVVKDAVQSVLNEVKRDNPFTDNRPGKKWLSLFLKRKPDIVKRNTEIISKARASVTEEKIRSWFAEVVSYTNKEGLADVLKDGNRIFNCDEIGMHTCPKTGIVLGPKGFKNLYEIASGPEKESITVLCTYSASGNVPPPMVVFPYKRIPTHIADSLPEGWAIGRSDSGWMVSSTFYEYVANAFYPWLVENDIEFPVILFLDGHKSHLSLELCTFCIEKKIIVYCLPPNSTHIMQPCDVAMFRPLKVCWKKIMRSRKQESGKTITKVNFMSLFSIAFEQSAKKETITNGFRACGLFPFNPDAIDYSKCISDRRKDMRNVTASVIPTLDEYAITKKVIEHILGPDETQKFIEMELENNDYDDTLFTVWKVCGELCRDPMESRSKSTTISEILPSNSDTGLHIDAAAALRPEVGVFFTSEEGTPLDIPIEFIGDDSSLFVEPNCVDDIFEYQTVIAKDIDGTFVLATEHHGTQEIQTRRVDKNDDERRQNDDVDKKNDTPMQLSGDNPKEIIKISSEISDPNNVETRSNEGSEERSLTVEGKGNPSSVTRKLPTIVDDVTIKNIWGRHLHWPEANEIKSKKKNANKLPFAISSKEWKEIEEKRKFTLLEKQNIAAEKRAQREEKRKEKEKEKATKTMKVKKETRKKNQPAKKVLVSDIPDPNNNINNGVQSFSHIMDKKIERATTRSTKRKSSARETGTKKVKLN